MRGAKTTKTTLSPYTALFRSISSPQRQLWVRYLFTHIVFSAKGRARVIVPDLKPELHAYLSGLTRELKGKAHAINGMEENVHLLVSLPPTISVSDSLRFIKAN